MSGTKDPQSHSRTDRFGAQSSDKCRSGEPATPTTGPARPRAREISSRSITPTRARPAPRRIRRTRRPRWRVLVVAQRLVIDPDVSASEQARLAKPAETLAARTVGYRATGPAAASDRRVRPGFQHAVPAARGQLRPAGTDDDGGGPVVGKHRAPMRIIQSVRVRSVKVPRAAQSMSNGFGVGQQIGCESVAAVDRNARCRRPRDSRSGIDGGPRKLPDPQSTVRHQADRGSPEAAACACDPVSGAAAGLEQRQLVRGGNGGGQATDRDCPCAAARSPPRDDIPRETG